MTDIQHNELPALCSSVCDIAYEAGQKILAIYNTDFAIENKADKSPLTEADLAAHHCIVRGLQELSPDTPILSEESEDINFEERQSWQQYWLVDPLDGTREFIKRNGEFTVNIALIEDDKVILGVIYVPVKDTFYWASKGNGAFRRVPNKTAESIQTKTTTKDDICIAGSRSHGNAQQQAFIQSIKKAEVLAVGSSLKFCLVADGTADIYPRFGPTSEWDTAAAQCIVEEAGGQVVTTDLNPLIYNQKSSLLNPTFLVIGDGEYNWSKHIDKALAVVD